MHFIACFEVLIFVGRARTLSYVSSAYIGWTRAHFIACFECLYRLGARALIVCFEVLISVGRARTSSYVLSAYSLRGVGRLWVA